MKLRNKLTNDISRARIAMYDSRDEMMQQLDQLDQRPSRQHPNLVGLIGFDSAIHRPEDWMPCTVRIVTEWLARGSLRDVLGNRLVDVTATNKAKMILGVVLGLRYLHRRGVVRASLRLERILVDDDFEAKIECFPYAIDVTAPPYLLNPDMFPSLDVATHMAPELLDSPHAISSPACDTFALGILIWEILTGVPLAVANGHKTDHEVRRWRKGGKRPDTSAMLPPTADLLSACWVTFWNDRPTIDEVFEELRRMRYQLIPGVDSTELEVYVGSILEREARTVDGVRT
jgi:serine/threonine protein kinase